MYKNGKPVENKKSKIDPNTFLPIEEKKEVKSDRRKIGKEKLTKQEQRELDF